MWGNEQIRWATAADLSQIHPLWEQVFGDPPEAQRAVLAAFGGPRRVLLLLEGGRLCSMTCLPTVALRDGWGQTERAAYLYALATHPDARGRGLAARLMARGEALLAAEGCGAVALVPAQPSLFAYYEGLGYQPAFFHCRWEGRAEGLPAPLSRPIAVSPEVYGRLRKATLGGTPRLDYPADLLLLQGLLSRLTGGGLYRLELPGGVGCAAVEGRGEEMWVKELLCAPGDGPQALAQLASLHSAPRWRVCSPDETGLGGRQLPFGVVRPLNGGVHPEPSYLGLAFD